MRRNDAERYGDGRLRSLLPIPAADDHKYSRGMAVLVAGSERYPGAACLAAAASQRAGAGYSLVYTAKGAVRTVQRHRPSLVVAPWDGLEADRLRASTEKAPCAYVVGPGFDAATRDASRLALLTLAKAKAPVLFDGGALPSLSTEVGRELCKNRFIEGLPTVVTPHGGEAARLAEAFGLPTAEPAALARTLSLAYGVVVVLKGPVTYVSDGDEVYAMDKGTPALAKAGTGDVLAGIVGAFLAQGLGPVDACMLGATLHARAGVLAEEALSPVSVIAEDVIDYLPAAVKDLLSNS